MVVKLLTLDILCPGCSSLKEKRFVLKSLKTRIRQKFNVSVAEVGYHDAWQRTQLAVVMVASDRRTVDSMAQRVLQLCDGEPRVEVCDVIQEFR